MVPSPRVVRFVPKNGRMAAFAMTSALLPRACIHMYSAPHSPEDRLGMAPCVAAIGRYAPPASDAAAARSPRNCER